MERDWVLVSTCENALNGTGLLVAELAAPANVAPLLEVAEEVLAVSAFTGVERVWADGVERGGGGRALGPAGVEPLAGGRAGAPAGAAGGVGRVWRLFDMIRAKRELGSLAR